MGLTRPLVPHLQNFVCNNMINDGDGDGDDGDGEGGEGEDGEGGEIMTMMKCDLTHAKATPSLACSDLRALPKLPPVSSFTLFSSVGALYILMHNFWSIQLNAAVSQESARVSSPVSLQLEAAQTTHGAQLT